MEILEITSAETLSLRHSILRPHQSIDDCVYAGDDDARSFHVGAFCEQQLVSIASILPQREERFAEFSTEAQFRLRGMATVEGYRGRGFGAAVLRYSLTRCWQLGGDVFWCNARTTAVGFYEKLGFQRLPVEFDVPGIGPHFVMYVEK